MSRLSIIMGGAKTIAVFRSSLFNVSWPKDAADPTTAPLGKDLADYLKSEFAENGLTTSIPIEGSDHWVFDVETQGRRFSLIIHWAPMGNPPSDYWVVQLRERVGLIAGLFGRRRSFDCERLHNVLQSVLEADANIQNLEWLDDVEFKRRY